MRLAPDRSKARFAILMAHRSAAQSSRSLEYRARVYVLAVGCAWTSVLLLRSSCPRFPNGLANSSGLVGCYMTGHHGMFATIELPPNSPLYPGMHRTSALQSRQYFRCPRDTPYVRHDLTLAEAESPRPSLRDPQGKLLLGDDIVENWRARIGRTTVRMRALYDTHAAAERRLVFDASSHDGWGIDCRGSSIGTMTRRMPAWQRQKSTFGSCSIISAKPPAASRRPFP